MAKMDKSQVVKAVNSELERAESFMDNRISTERAIAYDYYYGKPLGTEAEGRSHVVSCDVAQQVDSTLPSVLKIFVSGDSAVEFSPRGQEDVQSAEDATLSCNYVFYTQNNGYALAHDFLKDGLLQKTGVFKWKWDTSRVMHEKRYQGLDDFALQLLDSDPSTEIIEHTEYPDFEAMQQMMQQPPGPDGQVPEPPMLHDVTVRIKKESGKIKIVVPPPEEILISPDSMTLDVMEMPFIAHTPMLTASDLREMGVSQDVIDSLSQGDRDDVGSEVQNSRTDRLDATAFVLGNSGANDDSQKVYRYNECYIRIDEDGDGIAELRKICLVADEVLSDEPVDHIPLCIWTPKAMPHEVVGISQADDAIDIQLLKSTIWRAGMDNMYLSIAPRIHIKGDINLDDVLTVKPGGVIRGAPDSEVNPIIVPSMIGEAFQMLAYADQELAVRSGVGRNFDSVDPSAIDKNKTATEVNASVNRENAHVEVIARNAAEHGFKPLFRGILYLLAKHQQTALMVRIKKDFKPIDPTTWEKEYDMTCNVGLGMGTKDQQLAHLNAFGMDLQAIGQSPFAQQLLTAKNIFNYAKKKAELAGFKDVTPFVSDPDTMQPPPPPPPPPEIQKAQMQIEADKQKFQAESQIDMQKMQQEQQMAIQQAQIDAKLEKYKADLDAQVTIQIETMKAQIQQDLGMKQVMMQSEIGHRKVDAMNRPIPEKEDDDESDPKEERMLQIVSMMAQSMSDLKDAMNRPKQIVRGKDGRAIGVQ